MQNKTNVHLVPDCSSTIPMPGITSTVIGHRTLHWSDVVTSCIPKAFTISCPDMSTLLSIEKKEALYCVLSVI